jgi:hypothetical protein
LTKTAIPAAEARQALALIHPGDRVVATNLLGPHLAHRDVLVMFPYPFADGHPALPLTPSAQEVSAEAAARIDAVVVTLPDSPEGWQRLKDFEASPFRTEFRDVRHFGTVTVYRRPGP